jgi:hypothetical protein
MICCGNADEPTDSSKDARLIQWGVQRPRRWQVDLR